MVNRYCSVVNNVVARLDVLTFSSKCSTNVLMVETKAILWPQRPKTKERGKRRGQFGAKILLENFEFLKVPKVKHCKYNLE